MGLFDTLFGSKAKASEAQTPAEVKQASEGAQANMKAYDAQTSADTAGGAAATMQRAQEAARAGAAGQSDQAVAQAAKAARTGGMMPGQAALAGAGQAATAYGTGMAQGTDQFNQNVTREAQLGESMSGRLAQSGQTQSQINMSNANAQTQASMANAQKGGIINQVAGLAAGVGSIIPGAKPAAAAASAGIGSDRRIKEDIHPSGSISDSLAKIKSYAYKYKGGDRPEAGVMAQDLEKTKAAPSVYETTQGKAVDTNRLTTINTAAIAEQGRRVKQIESLIRELKAVKHG